MRADASGLLLLTAHCCAASAMRPNLLLFTPDALRAESLGCYGNGFTHTPNFDAFAASGTRFAQAHTSHTACTQSRCSFATGWYPHSKGHRTLWNLLDADEPNLFKYLKRAGYRVFAWGKNDLLTEAAAAESFDDAFEAHGHTPHSGANPFAFEDNLYYSFLHEAVPGRAQDHRDYANVRKAIDWLSSPESHTSPWFVPVRRCFSIPLLEDREDRREYARCIFLPLSAPHPPYSCPEPYHSLLNASDAPPLRPRGAGKPDFHALIRRYRRLDALPEPAAALGRLHAVYQGCIAYADWCFGELMAALDANLHRDNTAVLVFSDHGDYAGDYGLVEKWPSGLEDVLTRVPLLVRVPGGAVGHVVEEQVQLFDIMPLCLEMAGVNAEHVHFAKSLLPMVLRGEQGEPGRAVFAEGGFSSDEPQCLEGQKYPLGHPNFWMNWLLDPRGPYYPKVIQQQEHPLSVCRAAMVRTLQWKLVRRGDPKAPEHDSELYDLTEDPLELQNLYGRPEHEETQRALEAELLQWYLLTSDVPKPREDPRHWPHHLPSPAYTAPAVAACVAAGALALLGCRRCCGRGRVKNA